MPQSEIDRIDPEPVVVTLESGRQYQIVRARTRQIMKGLKVLTAGAGPLILQSLGQNLGNAGFGDQLMAALIMALPNADNEVVEFIQSMCLPVGLQTDKRGEVLGRKAREERAAHNAAIWEHTAEDLGNPRPDDLLTIIEAIAIQEAPEIQALGKRIAEMIERISKLMPKSEPDEADELDETSI